MSIALQGEKLPVSYLSLSQIESLTTISHPLNPPWCHSNLPRLLLVAVVDAALVDFPYKVLLEKHFTFFTRMHKGKNSRLSLFIFLFSRECPFYVGQNSRLLSLYH